ncbi:MAG: S53 family peptidase [Deinococcales bacterium]
MGLRRGLGLAGVIGALALVLASCAQPNSGAGALGTQAVPAGHGNALGLHPAGPASAPVCPGPIARGNAGCTSRVIVTKGGKPATNTNPQGYAPFQIRHAYGFDQLSATGSNTTIAVVDAYDDPNARADLDAFKSAFSDNAPFSGTSLTSDCPFTKVNQAGQAGNYPKKDSGWALEISLDVQWACAIAPSANILLVEANSSSFSDLLAAVDEAVRLGANVVSMSWGGSESSSETSYDSAFAASGVTFTASSGDSGTGVIYPAASPYVVGVGGTTLLLDGSGNPVSGASETAWSGSGGGISAVEPPPAYQSTLSGAANGGASLPASGRGVPDVAYDADPSTGFSVYDSTTYQGTSGWFVVGGTSAGSPQWAALYALADAGRSASLSGTTSTSSGLTSPTYALAGSSYQSDFTDITSGNNCTSSGPKHGPHAGGGTSGSSPCQTTMGYDFVTGLGSPVANALVPALVGIGN